MASAQTLDEVVQQVVAALDAAGVPYMLTGSFASSLYGSPRATQDLDFVISLDARSLDALIERFPAERFYLSRAAAHQALQRTSLFNVIDLETGWKVDFIVRKSRDFSRAEFERRIPVDVFGTKLFVATPEDVLIAKLEWAKQSESDRQLDDAAGIIRTQGDKIDRGHIERWVAALGLEAQWAAALLRAG
jgi:hypothetical protein